MIPDQLKHYARAEYLCNVYDFIGAGEGKELTPRDVGLIKRDFPSVEQWFDALGPVSKMRVLKLLRKQYERSTLPLGLSCGR